MIVEENKVKNKIKRSISAIRSGDIAALEGSV